MCSNSNLSNGKYSKTELLWATEGVPECFNVGIDDGCLVKTVLETIVGFVDGVIDGISDGVEDGQLKELN